MEERLLFAPSACLGESKARTYCGPTAIVAITGASYENVYKKIRRIRKKNGRQIRAFRENRFGHYVDDGRLLPIKGTGTHEVLDCLRMLGKIVKEKGSGYDRNRGPLGFRGDGSMERVRIGGYMTLGEFCKDRGHMGPFLVEVTGHWIAVGWGKIACSQYAWKDSPVPWQEYKSLSRRVVAWYRF